MPNRIILEVGAEIVIVPLKGTVGQIRAMVKRFAIAKGVQVEGRTSAQVGEGALLALLRIARDGSIDRQRLELLEVERATREASIASENDLFDEPPVVP